jgi:hypothetical protein
MITKEELLELAEMNHTNCVSIFIPTHRKGESTLKGKDALNFKHQVREIRSKLESRGMDDLEVNTFLEPINELLEDGEFWRNQLDGLAVFLSDKIFRKYSVPVHFDELNYLSNEFYLKPLIQVLNENGVFYLLTLRKDDIKFYRATKNIIVEMKVDDQIPTRLEDRVGYDHEQKSLQFRTQQGNQGAGSFHGHQDSDSEEKKELVEFFRAVDKGLMEYLREDPRITLLVCSLDFYFPIYKEVNTYKSLFPEHISANPAEVDLAEIHQKARELLQPHFDKTKQEKLAKFEGLYGTGKTSNDLEEIVNASFDGKVDTLFLEKNADMFGIYNPSTRKIKVEESHHSPNVSLTNLIAMRVLKDGGNVYLLDREAMPAKFSIAYALYRY